MFMLLYSTDCYSNFLVSMLILIVLWFTQGQLVEAINNGSLPSSNVIGITPQLAEELDYGRGLGIKFYPLDAYNFTSRAQEVIVFEAALGLSEADKTFLQSIVDECPTNPSKAEGDFVTVNDNKFEYLGENFEFFGFNSYQVVKQQLNVNSRNSVDKLFRLASEQGQQVARFWLFSDNIRPGPTSWNEDVFVAIDQLIEIAKKYNIKIVLTFANYWEHFLGTEQYVSWAFGGLNGKTIFDFYTDPTVRLLYKSHVCKCINRVNSVSGVRWRDDPTIMAWNLMNEPRCPGCLANNSRDSVSNAWIREMAAFVKSIDPNHLVTTGMEAFSTKENNGYLDNPGTWALCQGTDFVKGHQDSNIDYATLHIYPEHKGWDFDNRRFCDADCQINWSQQFFESRIQAATEDIQKPLVLEEFGMSTKLTYRVSLENGGYFEQNYSRMQRVSMYKRILETMLSALERGQNIRGVMFWMAIVDSYPDWDGFSIPLDSGFQFEGTPRGVYNILQQFRQEEQVRECTNQESSWRPNAIRPLPLTVVVEGNSATQLIVNAAVKLAMKNEGSLPSIPEPLPPSSGDCVDTPPDNRFTCEEQKKFGKCNEDWMLDGGFCKLTCERCSVECTNIAPDNRFSCQQQKAFGKCEARWMLEGDFCKSTCGRCSTSQRPSPSMVPSGPSASVPAEVSPASILLPLQAPSSSLPPSQPMMPTTSLPAESPTLLLNLVCVDIAPDTTYTCQQQKNFGKCNAPWMINGNYCLQTCGRCPLPPTPSPPSQTIIELEPVCIDVAPNNNYTCQEQKEFKKCQEDWFVRGGYCRHTCGRCDELESCNDVTPGVIFTCEQQKRFGKCNKSWIVDNGYCKKTCQRCNQ